MLVGGAAGFAQILAQSSAPTVVVICVDCLRADQVGCYGCPEPTTPSLDVLARESVVFEKAITNCNWTKPSIASLFTGLRPSEHGVIETVDIGGDIAEGTALPPTAATLAALFRAAGYATGAILCQPHLVAKLGFAQGFDHYDEGVYRYDRIRLKTAQWLSLQARRKPVFAYVHFIDCHAPYLKTGPAAEAFGPIDLGVSMRRELRNASGWRQFMDDVNAGTRAISKELAAQFLNLYQGELRVVDGAIGGIIEVLKHLGRFDEAYLAVFGDHGENFLENGLLGHPPSGFFKEQTRVPMIVKFPRSLGIPAGRVNQEVQTIDLTATLSAAVGGHLGQGRNLMPAARGGALEPEFIVTESDSGMRITRSGLKGHVSWQDNVPRITKIVDPIADPRERVDLLPGHTTFADEAARFLSWWRLEAEKIRVALGPPTGGTATSENLQALRALGYLQ